MTRTKRASFFARFQRRDEGGVRRSKISADGPSGTVCEASRFAPSDGKAMIGEWHVDGWVSNVPGSKGKAGRFADHADALCRRIQCAIS